MQKKIVKNSNFSASSRRWMQRHITDPYVALAKKEGYRSRAAYKLLGIQAKFNLLKKGYRVLDLGSSPGSWSQVTSSIVTSSGAVVALDILPMKELSGVTFHQGDITKPETIELIESFSRFNVILSDMSPNTTGFKSVDHLRSMDLCELVLESSNKLLLAGGAVVMKLLVGGDQAEFLTRVKSSFQKVKFHKPAASRSGSREVYLVAMQKR
jgi:23S rRNA (uridine2552-2'-O)-methyltransferase